MIACGADFPLKSGEKNKQTKNNLVMFFSLKISTEDINPM